VNASNTKEVALWFCKFAETKKKKVPIDLAIQIDAAIGYKGVVT